MWKWAWKSLVSQKATLVGSAAGIAFAFLLAIFFDAVWRGESQQIIAYIRNMDADVWVMQRGVKNMHMATSFLFDWKADQIARIPGVKRVTPILYLNTVIHAGGQASFNYVVGLMPGDTRAGPWELAAGRALQGPGEAVIPDVLGKLTGVGIGDDIGITDKTFRVVGLSKGTYSAGNPVTFVSLPDLEDIVSSAGSYSYLLVDAEDGQDHAALAAEIMNQVEKVNASTSEDFVATDFSMAMQMGVEIIFLMTSICTLLAALIVGFSAYSHVMRSRKEMAVAKALGVANSSMIASVVFQAVVMTVLGLTAAIGIALLLIPTIPTLVPQLTLAMSAIAVARIGIVALVAAVLGAAFPAYAVSRVDPASTFQT